MHNIASLILAQARFAPAQCSPGMTAHAYYFDSGIEQGKWRVRHTQKPMTTHLGFFESELDAALAYDAYAISLAKSTDPFVHPKRLNFPREAVKDDLLAATRHSRKTGSVALEAGRQATKVRRPRTTTTLKSRTRTKRARGAERVAGGARKDCNLLPKRNTRAGGIQKDGKNSSKSRTGKKHSTSTAAG